MASQAAFAHFVTLPLLSPLFILRVSPCILLSVMSVLCVQRSGRADHCSLIYLRAAAAQDAQRLRSCAYDEKEEEGGGGLGMHLFLYMHMHVRVHRLQPVLGMCSSLAVPQEGSVGL